MSTKLKIGIAAAAALVMLAVLLTEGVLIPKQIQGDVLTVRLLHLKQSDSGLHATFDLHNENGPKVDLWSATLSDADEKREIDFETVTMDKGDRTTIEIEVPTEGKWQLRFRVNKHPKDRHRAGTLVYTDWIDSEEQVAKNQS